MASAPSSRPDVNLVSFGFMDESLSIDIIEPESLKTTFSHQASVLQRIKVVVFLPVGFQRRRHCSHFNSCGLEIITASHTHLTETQTGFAASPQLISSLQSVRSLDGSVPRFQGRAPRRIRERVKKSELNAKTFFASVLANGHEFFHPGESNLGLEKPKPSARRL